MERSELLALAAQIVEDRELLCDLDYRVDLELADLSEEDQVEARSVVYDRLEELGFEGV